MADVTEVVPASEWAGIVQRDKKQSRSAKLHSTFAYHCRARRLPPFVAELAFAKGLRDFPRWKEKKSDRAPQWRFDFAWPQFMVAVEIEGLSMREATLSDGTQRWVCMGGHASPSGFKDDCEKYNAAAQLGWFVLRFEQDAIGKDTRSSSIAVETTIRVLAARGWAP